MAVALPGSRAAMGDVEKRTRRGEELDVTAVTAWLASRVPGLTGTPRVTQYSGGASNWTYRVQYDAHDLVLRRPPAGTKAKGAHDMAREYRIQHALAPQFPRVPKMVALCDDESVLGVPFYVMGRVDGVIPRKEMPTPVTSETARKLCESAIDTLVELHAVDVEKAGLASLNKGPGYCRRQIDGWTERYERARTWNVPRFTRVIAWLDAHTPSDVGQCLIHNDYRLDNLVLDPDEPSKIRAVLDWELATVGDPLMDLGSSLAYWVESTDGFLFRTTRRQPSHLPGMLTRRGLIDAYLARSGRHVDDFRFYEVYGLFRLAGIAQQIYYRYHHGQTKNPAFRFFWVLVHALERKCLAQIV
jgi:aminoglycoside phosphotransferase (APT) family kinase protein